MFVQNSVDFYFYILLVTSDCMVQLNRLLRNDKAPDLSRLHSKDSIMYRGFNCEFIRIKFIMLPFSHLKL